MSPPAAVANADRVAPLVVITGASSGIGLALADAYAQRGWRLALIARRVDVLHEWVSGHAPQAGRVLCLCADVRRVDEIVAAGHRVMAEMGVPDVVIANAGISVGVDTAEASDLAVLQEIYATNVIGMAATFQPYLAPMQQARRGALVGIGSVGGIRGLPGHGGYCASKAAVISYCESLRVEQRAHGLRVVTLLPGFVATPLTQSNPYPMPFLMRPDAFAAQALKAIDQGVSRRVIPWPMGLVATLLRWLPDALFDRLMAGRPRKPRRAPAEE
ncbi:SDR family oxidoreductase [Sphaerotilus mobilis]|uniref:Short-subunit dehydrogenase n=1 Tax=Sphaerotilus mobilis TaxID=47994 RepID=A0A4Q7LFU5_9BURK|nr:SDR family oxidoreductase [Sphaerotilus mobilis]RZS53346.1 short-subunit dehydrogenase [Sphaerotilus mobilis]